MSDTIYKTIELYGTSRTSIEDAIGNALTKASASVRDMQWFVLTETRGHIADGKVDQWQVGLKVSFKLEG